VAVAKQNMTLEEFLALPEEKPALEYEDGVITRKVSPNNWHSAVQLTWADTINAHARPRKLARAFPELRTAWPRRSLVPDLAVFVWDRIPRDPSGKLRFTRASEPPDIAIEVISPGQGRDAMIRRLESFIAAGSRAAISTNPRTESIIVVRPGAEPVTLRRGDTLDLSDIIPGLRIELSALFDDLLD
jgi:Uma2 family endonuclease